MTTPVIFPLVPPSQSRATYVNPSAIAPLSSGIPRPGVDSVGRRSELPGLADQPLRWTDLAEELPDRVFRLWASGNEWNTQELVMARV